MVRNLKALGLALIAVFAMSAMAASAAHAVPAHFTADSTTTNAIFTAEEDPTETEQIFFTNFGEVNCNEVSAHGTAHQTSQTITATDVKYTSNYFGNTNCEAFGLQASINFNGCDYLFHAGEFVAAGHSTGTVDLVCPAGKSVQIISATCTVTVPAQNGLGPVTYTDGGGSPKDVTIDAEVTKIKYSGTGATCAGSFENGVYNGKATVKAFNDPGTGSHGSQVAATITST